MTKRQQDRQIGKTDYCKDNYDCIENYEQAKADNFDKDKWSIHHRLEMYWSKGTLIKNKMYYDVGPFNLIWLPYSEHKTDEGMDPNKAVYHKRILEEKRGWKDSDIYLATEHHQLESDEAYRNYMREYQREYRKLHPDYYKNLGKKRRRPGIIAKLNEKIADTDNHTGNQIKQYKKQLEELLKEN